MQYHLYPPYFRSDPHFSFADAWELFCCQLLNLEHNTDEIRRRKPPEQGIDLIWHTQGIAYQCKSVEHELGKFRLDKARASLQTALKHQSEIGWKTYTLCTNVTLTGTQEMALRRLCPTLDIYDHSRWQTLCQRFHSHIAEYFCILLPIVATSLASEVQKINQRFARTFLPRFSPSEPLIHVLVGLHAYPSAFDLQVPARYTVQEFLLLLKELFGLPDPLAATDADETVFITHYLCLGEQEIPLYQQLGTLFKEDRPLFTVLRLTARSSSKGNTISTRYEGRPNKHVPLSSRSSTFWEEQVLAQYTQMLIRAFDQAAQRFQ